MSCESPSKRRRSARLQSDELLRLRSEAQYEHALEPFQTGDGRGQGVRATQRIPKRSNVLFYEGVLMTRAQGEQQEEYYEGRGDSNSYTYWFTAHMPEATVMCLDATASTHISKFINHSRKRPNIVPKLIMINGKPRLIFRSKVDIEAGTELLFDYGDKRPAVVAVHPWLLQ